LETDRIFRDLRFDFLNELPTLDKPWARLGPGARLKRALQNAVAVLFSSVLLLVIARGVSHPAVMKRGREHEIASIGVGRGKIVSSDNSSSKVFCL
jgi:hypothetical protein